MSANPTVAFQPASGPNVDWERRGPCSHSVQFYEDDRVLLDGLTRFVGSALGAGDAAVVIATEAHRQGLIERLQSSGLNVSHAVLHGRFVQLDAADTLSKFMVDGWPDGARFRAVLEPLLHQLMAATQRDNPQICAFGEMVALLWQAGMSEAAVRLEQLWNELAQSYSFHLHCAYPMSYFSDAGHHAALDQICAEHTHVLPAESYTALATADEKMRVVALLQQKAQALQSIANERERLAFALAQEIEGLRRLHELSTRLSWLDLDRLMHEILSAVAELQKTNMGLLSLCNETADELHVGASVGFSQEFLSKVGSVPAGAGACGTCLERGERVIVEDTESDPAFASYRDAARLAGFRAVHSTPLIDRAGKLLGVLSVHFRQPHRPSERDIRLTELYARLVVTAIENARLSGALIQAEKLAATGRLAATVAHEINNPLEAVTNYIYLAKRHPGLPDSVNRHLDYADQELTRVGRIAQQTLGFYRDNSGPVKVDLGKAAEDVLTIYERKLHHKALRVVREIQPGLTLLTLEGELKQAISNLIANAIDACADGGVIRVRARAFTTSGPRIRFTVADNGSGIAPKVREKLFTPFFTTKEQVGTGLGLWTTRNLLEKQGGSIRVRSVEGVGTVVSLSLPARN
jgi:signal transduction histidine kinase